MRFFLEDRSFAYSKTYLLISLLRQGADGRAGAPGNMGPRGPKVRIITIQKMYRFFCEHLISILVFELHFNVGREHSTVKCGKFSLSQRPLQNYGKFNLVNLHLINTQMGLLRSRCNYVLLPSITFRIIAYMTFIT